MSGMPNTSCTALKKRGALSARHDTISHSSAIWFIWPSTYHDDTVANWRRGFPIGLPVNTQVKTRLRPVVEGNSVGLTSLALPD